jgi:hypothetical protein
MVIAPRFQLGLHFVSFVVVFYRPLMTTRYKDQFRYSCRNSFFYILIRGLSKPASFLGLPLAGKKRVPIPQRGKQLWLFLHDCSFIKQVSSGNLQQFQQPFLIETGIPIPLPCHLLPGLSPATT